MVVELLKREGSHVRNMGKRPILAGIVALLILLMNVAPLVVYAEAGLLQAPKLEAPKYQGSDLQAPVWQQQQLQVPDWETPQLESPKWDTPGGKVPQLNPPGTTAPDLNAPERGLPDYQVPGYDIPQLQTPSGNGSQLKPVELKPGELKPSSSEPFGETKGYDVMKLSFKDVVGGTLGYSASLIEQGEVDLRGGGGKYGLFLLELGVKGLDIGVKDTPLGNLTGLTLDGLDAKVAFENYKFVLEQRPNSTFGGLDATRSVTNGGGAQGAVRMPGIIKGLNVGIASISLPFDAFDTYTKFDQAFDSKLSKDKQNEKFVDGVGSFGSVLMDAGVIASVIPGGQAVGTVLVVAGGILWGLSRLVKWSDKLSGGAVSRGIRNGVGKALGWVKSIFA